MCIFVTLIRQLSNVTIEYGRKRIRWKVSGLDGGELVIDPYKILATPLKPKAIPFTRQLTPYTLHTVFLSTCS